MALASLQREFMAGIRGDAPLAPRLDVYRRNAFANHHNALAATYPVVRRLVGEAFFREAARQFAQATPSASGDLGMYGAAFGDFLARYEHARSLAYLPDVARLEWACHECDRAADAERFDFAGLAAVAAQRHGDLRFRLHPATRLVRSSHPIASIWLANQPRADGIPTRSEGPEHVLVRRGLSAATVEAIDEDMWNLLASIDRGESLAQACDRIGEQAAERLLAAMLSQRVADGTIRGFELRPPA